LTKLLNTETDNVHMPYLTVCVSILH